MKKIKLKICAILLMQFFTEFTKADECSEKLIVCEKNKNRFCYSDEDLHIQHQGLVTTFQMENIVNIIKQENNQKDKLYIEGLYDSETNNLTIVTTDNYADYSLDESALKISLKIEFQCSTSYTSNLYFVQSISEENVYAPSFSQEVYEFTVSLPLTLGYDCIFKNISAFDRDLKYHKITFSSIDTDLFEVKNTEETENKGHTSFALLKLIKPITYINDQLEFTIKAQDNGEPPKTALAKVVIKPNKLGSLPSQPRFKENFYEGKLIENNELVIPHAELESGTYSENVTFSTYGRDESLFKIESKENIVSVELNKDITEDDVKDKTFLTFSISAKNENLNETGRTAFAVSLPVKSSGLELKFSKPVFYGKFNETNDLSMENITLHDISTVPLTEFSLEGSDSEYFNITKDENAGKITFSRDDFPEEWNTMTFLTFYVRGRKTNSNDTLAVVIITLPDKLEIPKFSQVLYEGKILSTDNISVPQIPVANFVGNWQFKLSGSNCFSMDVKVGVITISLTESLPEDILNSNAYIALTLEAKLDKSLSLASIILETPKIKQIIRPEFKDRFYKGSIDSNLEFSMEPVKISNDVKLKAVMLEEGDSKYFAAEIVEEEILIQIEGLSEEDIEGRKYFEFLIVAETPENITNSVIVIIDLPFRCGSSTCPPCPPCTTPVPATTTTITTTNGLPEYIPKFEKDLYLFFVKPDELGPFGEVKATIEEGTNTDIKYSFGEIDGNLKTRININDEGTLTAEARIEPGVYIFIVLAEHAPSRSVGKTTVQLQVNPIKLCSDENSLVENSLLIKHLKEEEPHYGILDIASGNCHFEIFSVEPNDKEYFRKNETTNKLDMISVDREDLIFNEMLVVQIQVKLILKDKQDVAEKSLSGSLDYSRYIKKIRQASPNLTETRSYILTNDIPSKNSETTLTVIIEDINDNSPIFTYPSGKSHLVGYPHTDLSINIFPEYLMQVYAIDSDIGINAKIRFTLEDSNFGINETNGIIYPFANALNDLGQTKFTVYAVDKDGAEDGLRTPMEINVKKITSEHLILLKFEGETFGNVDEILKTVSEQINYNLRFIKHAIVPSQESSSFKIMDGIYNMFKAKEQKTLLKIWAYSFNNNNDPVDSVTLMSAISGNPSLKAESYRDDKTTLPGNVTGYVVGISILSVICLGMIGFLTWVYYFRQLVYRRMSSPSRSEISSFSTNVESKSADENGKSAETNYLKRESMKIVGTTTHETSDFQNRIMEELNDKLYETIDSDIEQSMEIGPEEDNIERRKSVVTFNELVERIEIESDGAAHSDSESSDVRL